MGEGGGQVLRTALSLSSVLSLPVRIENIRAGRPKPGLKPSHLTAVRALSAISSAEVDGDSIGSSSLLFSPGSARGGVFSFDTGTAGSITLIMQALLPVMVFSGGHFRVSISGGTDVAWSPPIDHTRNVLLPVLASAGAVIETEVERRGYYPKGGGKVRTEAGPSSFHGLSLSGSLRGGAVKGHLHISGLPSHVALRLMASAGNWNAAPFLRRPVRPVFLQPYGQPEALFPSGRHPSVDAVSLRRRWEKRSLSPS